MSGFVFTPLNGRSADFPRVSAAEQEADGGFRFTPLEPEQPSVLRNVALNNPLTAAAETVANLGSQLVGIPAAGYAGLATEAGRALGLTEKTGADVVHAVGEKLTYVPRGELGKAAVEVATWPFQKLHELAEYAGEGWQEATGSPGAATAAHTMVEGVGGVIFAPGIKAGRAGVAKAREKFSAAREAPDAGQTQAAGPEAPAAAGREPEVQAGGQGGRQSVEATSWRFTPTEEVANAAPAANPARSAAETAAGVPEPIPPHQTAPAAEIAARAPAVAAEAAVADIRARAQRALKDFDAQSTNPTPARAQRLAGDDPQVYRAESEGLAILRREGDQGLPGVDGEFQFIPLRDGPGADATTLAGQAERVGQLRSGELRLDDAGRAGEAPRILPEGEYPRPGHDSGGGIPPARPAEAEFRFTPLAERPAAGKPAGGETVPPLDVADAPRRDVAAAGLGEADRPAVESAVASSEARHAVGEGADAAALPQPRAARWALMEADNLKASHNANMQPRPENPFGRADATRHENAQAVQGIVNKFDPQRLAEALDDADGAPIVGRDGIVEAGQRRAIAIQRIYQDAPDGLKAHEYRSFIRNNAERFGLAPEQVDGMRSPVLVRLPSEPAPRRAAGYTAPEAGGFTHEHATAGRGSPGADRSGLPAGEDLFATIGGGRPAQGWAGATRIRGKDGQPTAVYRGAATELHRDHFAPQALGRATERPSAGLGVWFSTTAGDAAKFGKVSSYHLDIRRPKVFKVENLPGFDSIAEATKFRNALREQGYDGIAVDARHLGGPLHLVAFDPAQVVRRSQADGRLTTTTPPEAGNAAGLSQRRLAETDFSAEPVQDMAAGVQNGTWNPGTNYTPFVDDVRAPTSKATSTADLPAPIRRERILKQFADALGTTVYEGRVKGKKRLGFFRKGTEEVRIKRAADIEVAAHELAHLVDSRVPAIANAWRSDKALREELKSVSYDQKSVPEGFAESVRLFLTQPEALQAKAPRAAAWLEDFASSHQYGPALRKAQADMTAWFEQDALNRARSKIGDPGKVGPAMQRLGDWWREQRDQFRQAIVDDLDGVYRMERELKGGKIDPVGPYESARLSRASASIADGAVRWGHPVKNPDGSFRYAGKGLEEILKPVAESLDDALLYFVGRSARELQTQGREHLFTPGEIDGMLRLRTPERERAFREYQTWNRGVLDFAEAQGVINAESRRMWQRTQYLPFHRVGQTEGFKGKPGDWSGIKALTGGTENLRDILGNMVGNAAQLIDKAVKNEARLKVAALAEKTPGAGKFMVKIDAETRPVKIDTQQVIDGLLKALGIDRSGYTARGEKLPKYVQKIIEGLEADLAKSPGFEFVIGGQPPAGRNVVAVLKNGRPTWYEVGDPILYRSLLAIDRPVQGWLVRMLGAPKRIGQSSITLSLDFFGANIARDTLMGAVMTRSGFRPIIDSLQGMRLRITSDPIYKDYIANGGGLSSIYLDEGALRSKLKRFYQRQGINIKTVLDTPEKLLNAVETLGDAFEMSTRLGEYRRAIQRGEHPRHAAYRGREVSTDFAMRGDSKTLGFLYDTVMFLKAATVSWDRLVRGVAHDPNKGAIAAKTAAIAGMSAALYMLNRDDPRYADLPDWDRDSNWHIFVGEHHFRYPKIWEIGSVASMAERATEKLMQEDPEGLGKDFARILGNTFHINLMPQLVAPLYEQATNRNSFTKSPIETPGMEGVQPFLRAKPGTSETFKALGMATKDNPEWAQVNPARAEALLRGYLNTWGMYGLMLTDQAFFGDKLPEKRADELPVVRRFYSQEPPKHTKFESQFYEMLGEARRLRGTLKELDELGRPELADRKEKSPLAGEAKPLERAQKTLGAIGREMEAVRRDAGLTPREKRQKLDTLTVERNALFKAAVQDSKAAQKAKALTPADMAKRGVLE